MTEAEVLQKRRAYLLESIAQASDEIKKSNDILNEVQECR